MIRILREYTLDDSDGNVEEYNGFYIYELDGHYEVQDANGDFVVSADTPREARFEIDKYIDDNILNDGCGSSKKKHKSENTVTTYRNKRNPNKYINVKRDSSRHYNSQQYMAWETDNGEVKNFTGAKDTKKGRYFRTNKSTLDDILQDYEEITESFVTDREKEILDIYGKSIWDMSNEELIEYDLTDDWAKLVDTHYDFEESED